ncbi:MAG: aminomethyl-transferring glycine dehydrogenase subunit GcvPA [Acidimicrobiales bacterium]
MGHFVPHTDVELDSMLADIGLESLDQLFEVVPAALRLAGGLDLPDGRSEPDVDAEMRRLAARNRVGPELVCFAGAGAYDHEVPAVTRSLTFRSEFVTAYTPYQPEVAQGVLQALFEYQTLVARLSGLTVANASLYDGASAAVEATNLAATTTRRSTFWVSGGIHPHWRAVLDTFAAGTGHRLVDAPLRDGATDWGALDASVDASLAGGEAPAALLVSNPNYLGVIEDVRSARAVADRHGALLLAGFDPVCAGLLRSPGADGADVAVGEGQPFGTPLSFGGPYLGLFACRLEHVRRLPGRLVGRTVDTQGRPAYVTTLRAREQDIRREKASSNVCTNQTLIAVAAMIQLSWLGTAGLAELALRCARGSRYAREALLAIPGVEPWVDAPTLREFAVRLPVPPELAVARMAEEGFLAGVPVGLSGGVVTDGAAAGEQGGREAPLDGPPGLLVAVTERRTREEIDAFAAALEKVVR